jgi:hypothetical protein
MSNGQDEPADRDDGRVLAPDELDISDDEHVAEIEEGRYVVSPDDPIENEASSTTGHTEREPDREREPNRDVESESETDERSSRSLTGGSALEPDEPTAQPASQPTELTEQRVHEWLNTEFEERNSRYGFDVTGTFDGRVHQRQMMSNDVVTIFESLILWYAQHIDSNTPVEEVLGILLMEANVPIRYPPESLQRVVKAAGLGPDDTIADLMAAVDDDGLKF